VAQLLDSNSGLAGVDDAQGAEHQGKGQSKFEKRFHGELYSSSGGGLKTARLCPWPGQNGSATFAIQLCGFAISAMLQGDHTGQSCFQSMTERR
jgi:hypothetical protein